MNYKNRLFAVCIALVSLISCSTEDTEIDTEILNNVAVAEAEASIVDETSIDSVGDIDIAELENIQKNRAGSGPCRNVVIIDGYAYGACDGQILIGELQTGTITVFESAADDITADAERGLLFTQSGSSIRMFTVENPQAPVEVDNATANFGLFSGISAAGCTLAVSGGVGGSDTRVFVYSADTLTIEVTENGIPAADNVTGTPDVHVAVTGGGEIMAFYSQDIGAVANWAIQPAIFNGAAELQSTPDRIVLTQGAFPGPFGDPFGPANFPVESEFLNDRLYVAHFAVDGVEVIDVNNGTLLSPIDLGYEPTNIGTDGESLFVVGVNNDEVDIIDPDSGAVLDSIGNLQEPTGVAANATHIAVADQTLGLVIITR